MVRKASRPCRELEQICRGIKDAEALGYGSMGT